MRIAIRVDGGGWRGMGHVARCEAIAVELQRLGCEVVFATRTPDVMQRLGRVAPSKLLIGPSDKAALEALNCDVLLIDLPYPTEGIRPMRPTYVIPRSHPWPGTELEMDFSRAILRRDFRDIEVHYEPHDPPRIFLSAGGTDPRGVLNKLIEAVGLLDFRVDTVIADGSLTNVVDEMCRCDIALISYGVTALECCACGLPALHLCITDGHAKGARAIEAAGAAVYLGTSDTTGEEHIARVMTDLLDDPELLARMSERGRALIDGRGAERVAREIVEE